MSDEKDSKELKENNNINDKIDNNKEDINQEDLGKEISILHYLENPYLNKKVESPRTIKAIKLLGCAMDDIYFLTFPEFIDNYQEYRRFPKNIQKYLYNSYENYRLMKIEVIKEKRDYIIQNNIDINEDIYINQDIPMPTFSSSIKKEMAKFEQMKKKDELDLIKEIEAELERQILLKEEEAKIRRKNMKKDIFQKNAEIKHFKDKKKLEIRENKKYELEKERKVKLEENNKKQYLMAQEFEKRKELEEKKRLK